MLIDIVAAPAEEASSSLVSRSTRGAWPALPAKTVDTLKLATLAFLLKGEPPDDDPVIQYMDSFRTVADGGEDGPWIQQIPQALVDELARLPDERVAEAARAWAETDEAMRDGWNAKDTAEFLKALSKFASEARTAGRVLLVWITP